MASSSNELVNVNNILSNIIWDNGTDDEFHTMDSVDSDGETNESSFTKDEVEHIKKEMEIKHAREKREIEREKSEEIERLLREKHTVEMKNEQLKYRADQIERVKRAEIEAEKRLHAEQLHREKLQQEEQRKQLEQKEREKQKIQREKDEEIEKLSKRIEDLELNNVKTRLALKRRNRNAEIEKIAKTNGVSRLESVLIVRLQRNNAIYAFRRQFAALLPTVLERLNRGEIKSFVCWFVTDNAVQDFNRCKDYVREQVSKDESKALHVSQNTIEVKEKSGNSISTDVKVDDIIRSLLRNLYLVEADINFLLNLFYPRLFNVSSNSTPSSPVLKNVYPWLTEEFAKYLTRMSNRKVATQRNKRK